MKPIWYFVGIILAVMGLVLFVNGIVSLFSPAEKETVLGYLHPTIWWGGLMIIVGLIYIIKNKKITIN